MFPHGGPGVALLLLRISVVAFLIILAVNYDGSFRRLVFGGALLISFSLLIGFLTPFLCVIGAALVTANMLINPQASSVICVIAIANAVALALLGPGAYSLDSKLFGRRVTIVRPGNKFYRLF
jgi:uncharacterized membrane protein YphA (DoxX/SURF4 family)